MRSAEPSRAEIEALRGPVLLEFGTSWCGFCRRARPLVAAALSKRPHVRHIQVEDGSGLPLGRSFQVRLWPTLVFLADGVERARVVRPNDAADIEAALATLDRAA